MYYFCLFVFVFLCDRLFEVQASLKPNTPASASWNSEITGVYHVILKCFAVRGLLCTWLLLNSWAFIMLILFIFIHLYFLDFCWDFLFYPLLGQGCVILLIPLCLFKTQAVQYLVVFICYVVLIIPFNSVDLVCEQI